MNRFKELSLSLVWNISKLERRSLEKWKRFLSHISGIPSHSSLPLGILESTETRYIEPFTELYRSYDSYIACMTSFHCLQGGRNLCKLILISLTARSDFLSMFTERLFNVRRFQLECDWMYLKYNSNEIGQMKILETFFEPLELLISYKKLTYKFIFSGCWEHVTQWYRWVTSCNLQPALGDIAASVPKFSIRLHFV